jgi:hypothetical protein
MMESNGLLVKAYQKMIFISAEMEFGRFL